MNCFHDLLGTEQTVAHCLVDNCHLPVNPVLLTCVNRVMLAAKYFKDHRTILTRQQVSNNSFLSVWIACVVTEIKAA